MFKVLIADDERIISEGLKMLVDWNALGYYVCGSAANGIDLLELNDKYKPHLIITDIKMPKMDGIEAITELRARGFDTEVLILSGYAEFGYAKSALEFGCSGYLMKPVDDEELTGHLKRIREKISGKDDITAADEYLYGEMPLSGTSTDMGVIKDVTVYIQRKYKEKINLKTVSEHFFINAAYLGQLFRRKMGVSFNDYLTDLRMEKAKELLLATTKSIAEISYAVGFDDPNYFSARFAKAEGLSPREYRMKARE